MMYRVETLDEVEGRSVWVVERTYRLPFLEGRDARGLTIDEALKVFGTIVRIGESARIVLEGDDPSEEAVIATTVDDDVSPHEESERSAVLRDLEAKIGSTRLRPEDSVEARALRYLVRKL